MDASAALVPSEVIVAIAAVTPSNETPTAEAVGRMVDMAVAKSPMWVLPNATVVMRVLVA